MASLYDIRSVVICLLAFAAFLRFEEPSKLFRSDVKIENDILKLSIQSSCRVSFSIFRRIKRALGLN